MRCADAERWDILNQLDAYWPERAGAVRALPLTSIGEFDESRLPPVLREIRLPHWAVDVGVDGVLCVPEFACAGGDGWERVDWLLAAFWYLHGIAERRFEAGHGPIHSYSFRLRGWPTRMWERAWVNRIALFLRRWAAHDSGQADEAIFGPLPKSEILVTHDVDAVRKTPAIRLKQSAFQFFNGARALARGKFADAGRRLGRGLKFLASSEDYWSFGKICALEEAAGVKSQFNFYGAAHRRGMEHLLDPSYDVRSVRISSLVHDLAARGWQIGLHQSYHAWQGDGRMAAQKKRLDESAEQSITSCRQHWLRFAWSETWRAQEEAGFTLDTTLGFNDRAGFRNASALTFRPLEARSLRALPMILMDSHLYDYAEETDESRRGRMRQLIDEVRAVGGQATVIWHTQVLGRDYGWEPGFKDLLAAL